MKAFERVVLKWNVSEERLVAGHVGTRLHVCEAGKDFEVEFLTTSWRQAAWGHCLPGPMLA